MALAGLLSAVDGWWPASQSDQDVVLESLLGQQLGILKPQHHFCVEFGFATGEPGSNSWSLRKNTRTGNDIRRVAQLFGADMAKHKPYRKSWRCMLMDASRVSGKPLGNYANSSFTVRTMVHSTNIASLFAENGVPKDVDYVSIDIDSADIWVLQALLTAGWRPLVISVEYNPNFPATTSPIVYPDPKRHGFAGDYTYTGWNHTCFLGSSARALEEMMVAHDYALTNVSLGFDLFFVRGDAWRPRPILTSVPGRANHVPTQRCFSPRGMYPQEAANYLSWSALQGGETVCRARLQAHRVLRELATAEGTCKKCFSRLQTMPVGLGTPACP